MKNNPYISKFANINLMEGSFIGEILFSNGLNIISGENGTGKTKLLQKIKGGQKEFGDNIATDKIVAFSPKRNADKINLNEFARKLKNQGLNKKKINETLNSNILKDENFVSYPSFAELFMLNYESLADEGDGSISKKDAVEKVKEDFNSVLRKVFPNYEIIAKWEEGEPNLKIQKNRITPFPVEGLSCGESEALSLIFNIYANKDVQDIYLIDEPEIHLNWTLEEGLFNFLDWFCEECDKQIILVSHSRMIFQQKFLKKTQFLIWENGKIVIKNTINENIREKIAGDAIKTISAIKCDVPIFFVEDDAHEKTLKTLADVLNKNIEIIKLGNSSNIKSFCRLSKTQSMKNVYFLIDGDNQGVDKDLKEEESLIHLKKYCIENYFLDPKILSEISKNSLTEEQAREKINFCIKGMKDNKFLAFTKLAENSIITEEILDIFDASKILDSLSEEVGFSNKYLLIEAFIRSLNSDQLMIFQEITCKF